MATLVCQVAIVSESSGINFSDLTRASAALQKQVTRDFSPLWDADATVDAFQKLEDIPLGYWPVMIRDDIGQPGALGVHLDKDGQPFALVAFTDSWPLTASHETLEMLADPFGNRLMAGDSPKPDQGRVEFLVEVCDPSEAAEFGYTVNGITVSDFYTPHYFDPVRADGVRYSFTGAIHEPREVLKGGYLSWHEPVSDHWWQEIYFDDQPQFRDLGPITQSVRSLREWIDRQTEAQSLKAMTRNKTKLLAATSAFSQAVARPSQSKAQGWRKLIEDLRREGSTHAQMAGNAAGKGIERRRPPYYGKEGEG